LVLRDSLLPRSTLKPAGGWLPRRDCRSRRCQQTVPLPLRNVLAPKLSGRHLTSRSRCRKTLVSPWTIPGRLRLAGGRPQLTAGIRAGSYAHECTNPGFKRQSIHVFAMAWKPAFHAGIHADFLCSLLTAGAGISSSASSCPNSGAIALSRLNGRTFAHTLLLYCFEWFGDDGSSLESLALSICHFGG